MPLTPTLPNADVYPAGGVWLTTLAEKVDAVARFQPGDDWTITDTGRTRADGTWFLDWSRLTLSGDLGDLDLARFIDAERTRARQHLRRTVIAAVVDLRLPNAHRFRQPAQPVGVRTRCPRCRTVVPRGHVPGSVDCDDDRREAAWSRAQ